MFSFSPQIVIPAVSQTTATATATLMPTAQPLLLNQMPMLAAPGVQFILRPQTATPMATTGPKIQVINCCICIKSVDYGMLGNFDTLAFLCLQINILMTLFVEYLTQFY